MRAFLALALPQAPARAIARLQAQLPAGRAVPREKLHLTLAFLDDQPEERLEALHGELLGLHAPGFDIRLSGLGLFGGRLPKVLHVAAAPEPELLALHERVVAAARRAGIRPDRARYRPHVTIARFGRGLKRADAARLGRFLEAHGSFALPPFPVRAFALFRSILHPEGALHEELAAYPLHEPGGG